MTGTPSNARLARAHGAFNVISATTLLVIDVAYTARGRIPKVYLRDAVVLAGWTSAWLWALHPVSPNAR